MMDTLILTQRGIRSLITMAEVVPAVERAFLAHGRGEGLMPPAFCSVPHAEGARRGACHSGRMASVRSSTR